MMDQAYAALKAAARGFVNDECMTSGAAIAFYAVFSLPSLLVLVFTVAGWFGVTDERIREVVQTQIGLPAADPAARPQGEARSGGSGKPGDGTRAPMFSIAERQRTRSGSITLLGPASKAIGIGFLFFAATGVFSQLQRAINRAWQVEPDPETNAWRRLLVKRALSLAMIAVFAALLLASLVLTVLVERIIGSIRGSSPAIVITLLAEFVHTVVALGMATCLFAVMYKVLPDAQMRWRDLWIGALMTAVLFVIGKTLVGWYLRHVDMGASWGAAATSIIVMLVWVYYTALTVLFGAELTEAWVSRFGSGITAADGTVQVITRKKRFRWRAGRKRLK